MAGIKPGDRADGWSAGEETGLEQIRTRTVWRHRTISGHDNSL
jgi:hypothetical protein